MKRGSIAHLIGAGVGAVALAAAMGGVAAASNLHAHGTLPTGVGVITFVTGVPPGCTAVVSTTSVIKPISGNAVMHQNVNKTGAWFTETVTDTAELMTGGKVVATGHETEWDGGALNQLFTLGKTVLVTSFTSNFTGTWTTGGGTVSIHANGGSTTHDATVKLLFTVTATTPPLTIVTRGTVTRTFFNAVCS